jgi:hypothetical protein
MIRRGERAVLEAFEVEAQCVGTKTAQRRGSLANDHVAAPPIRSWIFWTSGLIADRPVRLHCATVKTDQKTGWPDLYLGAPTSIVGGSIMLQGCGTIGRAPYHRGVLTHGLRWMKGMKMSNPSRQHHRAKDRAAIWRGYFAALGGAG